MSESYIYWAEARIGIENEHSRVLDSLYSRLHDSELKPSLDFIIHFKDVTLAPKGRIVYLENSDVVSIIIPLLGALEIFTAKTRFFLEPTQYLNAKINNDGVREISNPYNLEHVNFIEIGFPVNLFGALSNKHVGNFDLETNINSLVGLTLPSGSNIKVYVGKFGSKKEALIELGHKFDAYFFVINGSFEVNGMLLQPRDSGFFSNIDFLDFESLSEESMVIVVIKKPW